MIFKWFRRKKKENPFFKEEGGINCTCKLTEREKLLTAGIIYGLPVGVNFNKHLLTEEVLLEFKNDFGYRDNTAEHHEAYINWMNYLGLDYYKHRYIVIRLINGIYEYTKGELDFRNRRMLKEITYKQKPKDKSKNIS